MRIECKCGSKRGKAHQRVGILTGTNTVVECRKCKRKFIQKD